MPLFMWPVDPSGGLSKAEKAECVKGDKDKGPCCLSFGKDELVARSLMSLFWCFTHVYSDAYVVSAILCNRICVEGTL